MNRPCLIWDLIVEEHPAYVAAGIGTETWLEYQVKIAREQEFAKWMGREVVLVRATVQEVLAELERIGLRCTNAAINLALWCLFERRQQRTAS